MKLLQIIGLGVALAGSTAASASVTCTALCVHLHPGIYGDLPECPEEKVISSLTQTAANFQATLDALSVACEKQAIMGVASRTYWGNKPETYAPCKTAIFQEVSDFGGFGTSTFRKKVAISPGTSCIIQ